MKHLTKAPVNIVFAVCVAFAVGPVYGVVTIDFDASTNGRFQGPVTASIPPDSLTGENAARMFLTDEALGRDLALDYSADFDSTLTFLSLDLYDYRLDGGQASADTAALTSHSGRLAADAFAIPSTNPINTKVETLYVAADPIGPASLAFNARDIGTGVDNVTIAANPEPGVLLLGGIGIVVAGWLAARRTMRKSPNRHESKGLRIPSGSKLTPIRFLPHED